MILRLQQHYNTCSIHICNIYKIRLSLCDWSLFISWWCAFQANPIVSFIILYKVRNMIINHTAILDIQHNQLRYKQLQVEQLAIQYVIHQLKSGTRALQSTYPSRHSARQQQCGIPSLVRWVSCSAVQCLACIDVDIYRLYYLTTLTYLRSSMRNGNSIWHCRCGRQAWPVKTHDLQCASKQKIVL